LKFLLTKVVRARSPTRSRICSRICFGRLFQSLGLLRSESSIAVVVLGHLRNNPKKELIMLAMADILPKNPYVLKQGILLKNGLIMD
jgi:hypothetical protein